jgi:hypothetical protein
MKAPVRLLERFDPMTVVRHRMAVAQSRENVRPLVVTTVGYHLFGTQEDCPLVPRKELHPKDWRKDTMRWIPGTAESTTRENS